MENNEVQKSIYDSEKYVKRAGLLNEFLWICAGADRKILRQCPTDYAKYAGIGGTILFTALMAALSGGYALFSVFKSSLTAGLFGVFWGLLIFNLDRFIVNTMYSDGKVTISWREFTSGLPRIIMAVFLGIVISTPLELKIFESEISVKIEEMKKDRLNEYTKADQIKLDSLKQFRQELVSAPIDPMFAVPMASSNDRARDLQAQKNAALTNRGSLQRDLSMVRAEINGKVSAQSKYDPASPRYAAIQKDINSLAARRAQLNREITAINSQLNSIESQLSNESKEYADAQKRAEIQRAQDVAMLKADIDHLEAKVNNASKEYEDVLKKDYGGFQAKMLAFSQMKKSTPSTRLVALFIMLLFVIIETAPTFFKMMIASGPYDDLLRAEMHRVRVLSDKRISDVNDEVNTAVTISVEKNKDRLAAELAANKAVLKKIADAQAELLDTALEEWRKDELEKVKTNPSAYVSSSSGTQSV